MTACKRTWRRRVDKVTAVAKQVGFDGAGATQAALNSIVKSLSEADRDKLRDLLRVPAAPAPAQSAAADVGAVLMRTLLADPGRQPR